MGGNKQKPGIKFYRMDTDHVLNTKVRLLINEFQSDGYFIWMCLIDFGYKKWGYYIDMNDEDELELFAADHCKKKLSLVKEVIGGCLRRGLFDKNVAKLSGILTSQMMQEVYIYATAERRRQGTTVDMREELIHPELFIKFGKIPPNIRIVHVKNGDPHVKNGESNVKISQTETKTETKTKKKGVTDPEISPPPDEAVAAAIAPPPKNLEESVEEKKQDSPAAPPPKTGIQMQETEPYWKALIQVWFDFGLEKFNEKPSFARDDPKIFKRIIQLLKAQAPGKKINWKLDTGPKMVREFLELAYKDKWLSEHFLLGNLEKQFDMINQRQASGKKDGRNVDLTYLFERYCEGDLDKRSILPEHFLKLKESRGLEIDQTIINIRKASLEGSNENHDTQLFLDYEKGRETKLTEADKPVLMRIAVLEFFKQAKEKKS